MVQLIVQMLGSPSEEDIFFPENENRVGPPSSLRTLLDLPDLPDPL